MDHEGRFSEGQPGFQQVMSGWDVLLGVVDNEVTVAALKVPPVLGQWEQKAPASFHGGY